MVHVNKREKFSDSASFKVLKEREKQSTIRWHSSKFDILDASITSYIFIRIIKKLFHIIFLLPRRDRVPSKLKLAYLTF